MYTWLHCSSKSVSFKEQFYKVLWKAQFRNKCLSSITLGDFDRNIWHHTEEENICIFSLSYGPKYHWISVKFSPRKSWFCSCPTFNLLLVPGKGDNSDFFVESPAFRIYPRVHISGKWKWIHSFRWTWKKVCRNIAIMDPSWEGNLYLHFFCGFLVLHHQVFWPFAENWV